MITAPKPMRVALEHLAENRFTQLYKQCAGRICSEKVASGLRRDLQVPFEAPKAKIPTKIRKFALSDFSVLFS